MIWLVIVAMLAVGVVLLFAEVAIIPGFGVAGISAIVLLVAGVLIAWTTYGAAWGIGALASAAVFATAIVALAPRTRAGKAFILKTAITDQHVTEPPVAVGAGGVAVTALRPAGAADIDGRRVDVVTDGQFVAAGTPVRVVSVEGSRVVVAIDIRPRPGPAASA